MKIFGREPAAIIGAVEATVILVLSLNQFGLDSGQVGVIMAFVSAAAGFVTALFTRETTLAIVLGFLRSGIALGVGFGLPVSDNTASAIMVTATAILQLWFRTQTVPLATPSLKEPTVVQGEVILPAQQLSAGGGTTNVVNYAAGSGPGMPYPYTG